MTERDTWSNLTIFEVENHLKWLLIRMPVLERQLKYQCAYGKARGADVKICLIDSRNIEHLLLMEIEQYASGKGLEKKVKTWAKRHLSKPNTTTIVISLVLQAFRNRLVTEFSKDSKIANMVFSTTFRMFPGSGDGQITEELRSFLTYWVEQKL